MASSKNLTTWVHSKKVSHCFLLYTYHMAKVKTFRKILSQSCLWSQEQCKEKKIKQTYPRKI